MGERETGTPAPWSVEAIKIIIWLASNFQTMGVCVAKYSIVRDIRSSYANWALSLLVQFLGEVEKEKKTINVILLKYHEKFKVEISSESIYTSDRITNDIMIYGNLLYKGSIFRMTPRFKYLLK